MAIHHDETGTVFTGADVQIYRLIMLKTALKLEAKTGLRHSGGALRPRLAAEFSLKPRAPYQAFIDAIEKRLAPARGL